ncbi:2-oxoglutarate dehydrogenase E1 component [Nannocystaceae bacterium ST9]
MDAEAALSVHNLAFLEALYEAYERDPSSVDPQWVPLLEGRDAEGQGGLPTVEPGSTAEQIALQTKVDSLIDAHRLHGHLRAQTDPLERPIATLASELDPAYYGLSDAHLDRSFHTNGLTPDKASLRDILARVRATYCRHVGVEYWHLYDATQRAWLQQRMEGCLNEVRPSPAEQIRLLRSLIHVDTVDAFLHAKFIGAKRFSIAGAESLIPLLDCLIEGAAEHQIGEVIFGMAHRGRLNVLMNILGKTPKEVFSEFSNTDAESYLGAGDVKYHLGYHRSHTTAKGRDIYLALAFNPSHLEAITPVIQGRVRAKQDSLPLLGHSASVAVTLHGDSSFAGQGVVAETLNMAALEGYEAGGVIRVVVNNQIGFTTDPSDSRSGIYATDVAHVLGVPIFHVNGDDPEAAAYVARLAIDWRQRFHRDVIIDLVCYRQFGHNEGDDPTFTQPSMYALIAEHPSVRKLYQARLAERGTISNADCERFIAEFTAEFDAAFEQAKASDPKAAFSPMHGVWTMYHGGLESAVADVDTAIEQPRLARLVDRLCTAPPGFTLHRKLERLLDESRQMATGAAEFTWATAELLAYASLVEEGVPVRVSGQDSQRGTFSHRHAVFTDNLTGRKWCPIQHLESEGQGRFSIYNSPLSEFAVLGFEFGYTLATPQGLTVWEAQFGDFANGAQVIIDQFLSSSEDKWNRISGLTLLLPHGYEGQGPEHSSARLERFLQLCAEDNMQVCNLTTPAQWFHVLRRQVVRNYRKPLVIMSPKSLLRFRPSFSPLSELTEGRFQRVIDDPRMPVGHEPVDAIERVLLCSGKVYYDLDHAREKSGRRDVALVRVEQLYPFDRTGEAIAAALARYPRASDVRWVQEEPRNMGAWHFMLPRLLELAAGRKLTYVGRPESASPATGSSEAHKMEVAQLLADAFG